MKFNYYPYAALNNLFTYSYSRTSDVHKNIIKRFNQHSIMVMNTSNPNPPGDQTKTSSSVVPNNSAISTTKTGTNSIPSSTSNEVVRPSPLSEDSNNVINRKRLLEKTEYEDLEQAPVKKTTALNLAKVDRYLSGPTTLSNTSSLAGNSAGQSEISPQSVLQWRQNLASELQGWATNGDCKDILSARTAVSALNDLSPGGALMKAARQELLAGQYPDSVQQDLKILYGSLSELLRHFWACFPPTTPLLQEKAIKMHDTLQKYQAKKLRPFENELVRQYSSGPKITVHLNRMLAAAERKFSTWQQKLQSKR